MDPEKLMAFLGMFVIENAVKEAALGRLETTFT
jgi:hypothetical protein